MTARASHPIARIARTDARTGLLAAGNHEQAQPRSDLMGIQPAK